MDTFSLTRRQRRMMHLQLKKSRNAETFRRIFALLAVDGGESVGRIARVLNVGRRTVYDWIDRYSAYKTPAALVRQEGQGRHRILDQDGRVFVRSVIKKSPLKFGYSETQWTIPLLRDYLRKSRHIELSQQTIRRQLHRLGYIWKGFRYVCGPIRNLRRENLNFAKLRG